jgi:hypothetical protein
MRVRNSKGSARRAEFFHLRAPALLEDHRGEYLLIQYRYRALLQQRRCALFIMIC